MGRVEKPEDLALARTERDRDLTAFTSKNALWGKVSGVTVMAPRFTRVVSWPATSSGMTDAGRPLFAVLRA